MVKEIAQYIENKTSFDVGTDLFAGAVPPSAVGDCIIVIDGGGKPNFYLTDAKEVLIQIISRATDYHTAMTNANALFALLHGAAGITLPIIVEGEEIYVNTIEAISVPQSLGQDEKGLFNISTNYVFRLQDA